MTLTQRATLPILPTLPCPRSKGSLLLPLTPTLDLPLTLYSILPLSFISFYFFTFFLAPFPYLCLSFQERYLLIHHFVFMCFFSIYSLEYLGSLFFSPSSFFLILSSLTLEIVSWASIFITHHLSSDIFLVPGGSLLLNSQHKVLVPCPSFVCPRPPGLAGWPLMPHPLAWFPWSPLHFLSVSLTYYVRHLVIVSPCLGLQLNVWVKKWLFLLYIH